MIWIVLLLAFGLAVTDWIVVAQKNKNVEKFVKPLTLLALILWCVLSALNAQFISAPSFIWLVLGLTFCMVGDIFLFLPPERWFMPGLGAFLLGHVFYIVSFGAFTIGADKFFPALLLGLSIIAADAFIVPRLISGLKKSGKGKMSGPIVVYSLVISFVLFSAAYKFLDAGWSLAESLLIAGGALSFFISDVLNAWERFVSKFKNDRMIIIMTYHIGQFGIATGMILHLSNIVAG